MELNSLLFPAPNINYTADELEGEIMYIPRFMKYSRSHRTLIKKEEKEKIDNIKQSNASGNNIS